MRNYFLCILSIAVLNTGCMHESSLDMDNRVITISLSSEILTYSHVLEHEIIAPWSIKSVDSLLLLRVLEFKNSMLVFDPKTKTILDTIFLSGKGPGEYNNMATQGQYQIERGDIKLWTRDNSLRKVRKTNISNYVTNAHEIEYDLKNDQLYNLYYINDNCLLGDYYDGSNLYLSVYDPATNKRRDLFSFFDRSMTDISMASCNSTLKNDKSHVAYAMMYLNQIVIASVDGLEKSSISIGVPVLTQEVLEKPLHERENYFLAITSSEDKICALLSPKAGETTSRILVVDWEGTPLKYIMLDRRLRTIVFDDKDSGSVYAIGHGEDEHIYKYDIF